MTPEQWQQVKAVFYEARERHGEARASYLAKACADDAVLREEVEAMLAEEAATEDDFLLQPAVAAVAPALVSVEEKSFAEGQRLGQYEIQRKLGEGGMGRVYLARDVRLGRAVALKTLRAEYCGNAERVRRFQQEARAASALNHPNILTIYEVAREDKQDFIATEFVEGQTLRALLNKGDLTLGAVLDIVIQVAQALATAHRAGIIHRDIKPENLMRRDDGFVKVLDFGLAKLAERREPTAFDTNTFSHLRTRPGVIMGTVTYMSPEQARGDEVDARSDVFSLGVVLYEMLTGQVPFDGRTTSDVIAALLEREPQPLDAHISGLPSAFQSIVTRALQKQCKDRYATMGELLAELRALKDELEITAKLKRSGKAKSAETSLLEMRVGHSQGQVVRTTNERPRGTTARLSTAVTWMQRRPFAALASLLLLLVASASVWAWYGGKLKFERGNSAAIDSVAVLPFADNTNDPQLNYLPDGLTDSLIGSLSQLPALTVMARGTVFTYKGKEVDPRAVGETLKVNAVVLGRVARQGEQMSISVELVDAATGARLWGRDYQPKPNGVLAVKEEITRELGEVLRPRLSRAERRQFNKPATADNEVWQLYLRGRHLLPQGRLEGYQKALEYFQEAVARDPRFAQGHAGVSEAYSILSAQFLPPSEAMPKARQAALTALALDETLPEAHKALALVKWWNDWDWPGAEREFQRAIQLNPNLTDVRAAYASGLSQHGRFTEAEAEARRAEANDPLSFQPGVTLGVIFYFARRGEAASAQFRKVLELYPSGASLHQRLALVCDLQGRHTEAVSLARRAGELDAGLTYRAWLAYSLARAGQRAEALSILREIQQHAARERVSPIHFAKIYVGLGDHEQTLHWLRKTYDEHSDHILSIGVDPIYDPLRNDPEFSALLKQIGLSQ